MVAITKYCITGADSMGFFGGGGNSGGQSAQSAINDFNIDQQFKKNQADIETKKRSLYQERLDIIKSQGGQQWTPKR